jgi:hypothetical protein
MTPPADPPDRLTLRRVLLGEVSEDERRAFEERALGDEALFERLMEEEAELLGELARGELSAGEARRLEAVYGASAEGRAKLAVARGLAAGEWSEVEAAADEGVRAPRWWERWLRPLLRPPRLVWLPTAAALAVAVLTGWLAVENRRLDRGVETLQALAAEARRVAEERAAQAEGAGREAEALRRRLAEQQQEIARLEAETASTPTLQPPPAAAFTLSLLVRRGETEVPRLALPPEAAAVVLTLPLAGLPPHDLYRLWVLDAAGEMVYARAGLAEPPEDAPLELRVEVPASALPAGRATVVLEGRQGEGWVELARRGVEVVGGSAVLP